MKKNNLNLTDYEKAIVFWWEMYLKKEKEEKNVTIQN